MKYYFLERNSKWNLLIIAIPFIAFFSYKLYNDSFIKNGNYTIGFITKKYWPINSYKKIDYKYNILGKVYTSTNIYNSPKKAMEKRYYLVQYSVKDPSYSTIFQDIPVPDSIVNAPSEGWKELPSWAVKKH